MASFDKQIVRDWMAANWDQQGEPPLLPEDIVARTADRYRELIERPRRLSRVPDLRVPISARMHDDRADA